MESLFYKKRTAILVIAALVILVFLLCMLLVTLTQLTSLKQASARLEEMVEDAKKDEAAKQELIEYRKTDKYVVDWAIKMGYIPDDVINYIKTEIDK